MNFLNVVQNVAKGITTLKSFSGTLGETFLGNFTTTPPKSRSSSSYSEQNKEFSTQSTSGVVTVVNCDKITSNKNVSRVTWDNTAM